MSRKDYSDDRSNRVLTGEVNVPVLEERLQVGVEKEETGRVRAIKKVHEENLIVSGPIYSEDLEIERVPLNQYVDAPPVVRQEGNTTIYPVVKEELVVQTRLVLVEEVRITKRQVESHVEEPVTIRREEVSVERSSDNSQSGNKQSET